MKALAFFGHAANGVVRTLAHERNLKIHWLSAHAVFMVCMALELPTWARLVLWTLTALVLAAELGNSAIERAIDGVCVERTPWARDAKDAAAGAVLILAVGAAAGFAAVVVAHADVVLRSGPSIRRTLALGLPSLGALGGVLFGPAKVGLTGGLAVVAAAPFAVLAIGARDPGSVVLGSALLVVATVSRVGAAARGSTE